MQTFLDSLSFLSPLGWITIAATSEGLSMLRFWGTDSPPGHEVLAFLQAAHPGFSVELSGNSVVLHQARRAVLQYFSERTPLPDIPLDMRRGTPFQQGVWKVLCSIPFGQTKSYSAVAEILGSPGSSRAVGQACGRNPIPIIVPCHRVVAANGSLGGFSSGLHIKAALLELETMREKPGLKVKFTAGAKRRFTGLKE